MQRAGPGRAARLPDPDHHRRAALGDRHRRHGPAGALQRAGHVGPRGRGGGRRRHAAARQDRHDHLRQPPGDASSSRSPASRERELADAAAARLAGDETPEGRSIVVLAKEKYNIRGREHGAAGMRSFIPFTAQTRISGIDVDGASIRKGAVDAVVAACKAKLGARRRSPSELEVDRRRGSPRSGGTPLAVAEGRRAAGRHPPQGHRQARHARALRRPAAHGHPHRHDHRRQPADRRGDRRRSRASTTSWPRPRPRTSSS